MNRKPQTGIGKRRQAGGDEGFMLLGLIVAIALILLALSVAAADIAFTLRREREVESVRRANQYVRAIRLYYKKFGHYPGSIEQLEGTSNVRYLRQRYIDPLTGKSDWRLIPPGQNKTTAKGFFGEPLTGLTTTGAGSSSTGTGSSGTSSGSGSTGTSGTSSSTDSGFGIGSSSTSGSSDSSGLGSAAGMKSQGMGGSSSSGPLMGVGSSATGKSILVVNEQTTYDTWEFLYDPRIETLIKAAQTMNGGSDGLGGISSQSSDSLGSSTSFSSSPSQ